MSGELAACAACGAPLFYPDEKVVIDASGGVVHGAGRPGTDQILLCADCAALRITPSTTEAR